MARLGPSPRNRQLGKYLFATGALVGVVTGAATGTIAGDVPLWTALGSVVGVTMGFALRASRPPY